MSASVLDRLPEIRARYDKICDLDDPKVQQLAAGLLYALDVPDLLAALDAALAVVAEYVCEEVPGERPWAVARWHNFTPAQEAVVAHVMAQRESGSVSVS